MNDFIRYRSIVALALGATLFTSACGRNDKTGAGATSGTESQHTERTGEGGRVIVVQLNSDATGNRFTPSEIVAERGDTVRFTIGVGVHNVNFLPDSNPGMSGLPKTSDLLQLPGQTYDLPVTLAKGRYYFQCDPHVLLGMKGHLTVKE